MSSDSMAFDLSDHIRVEVVLNPPPGCLNQPSLQSAPLVGEGLQFTGPPNKHGAIANHEHVITSCDCSFGQFHAQSSIAQLCCHQAGGLLSWQRSEPIQKV